MGVSDSYKLLCNEASFANEFLACRHHGMHGNFRYAAFTLLYALEKSLMIRSHIDNVVRAGLTPKLRDVETLTSMLTYTWGSADSQIMPPVRFRSTQATTLYDPPIDEFSVLLTDLKAGKKEAHEAIDGPSILIITEGSGRMSWKEKDGKGHEATLEKAGLVFFIGAGVPVDFVADDRGLTFYRAFVEVP